MQQKIIIGLALTLVIIIFIPFYWAMEPGRQEAARERQKAEAVERGAELYTSSCANCHGSRGEGAIGPALRGSQLDEAALEKEITRGMPEAGMPAWNEEEGGPLKRHQIKDLVTFIKNWDGASPPTPAPTPQTTPSAIAASELYAISCAGCHGANRQGVSELGDALIPEHLADDSDAEVRDIILNGIPGTPMPGFEGRLSSEEIDALLQLIKYTLP